MMPVRLEPAASQSRVKHSTTEPLRSLHFTFYSFLTVNPKASTLAHIDDPDEMLQGAAFHLVLQCMLKPRQSSGAEKCQILLTDSSRSGYDANSQHNL